VAAIVKAKIVTLMTISLAVSSLWLSPVTGSTNFQVESQLLFLRYDGRVEVSMSLAQKVNQTSISVLLLSDVIKSLTVLDALNQPLPFTLTGRNLTIYAQGTNTVTIQYSTDTVTAKTNATWTLAFSTPYNSTVLMPAGADILSVKPNPRATTVEGNQTVLDLYPNNYTITYTLTAPIQGQLSTTIFSWLIGSGLPYLAGILALIGAITGSLLLRRRRNIQEQYREVRPEDRTVLEYLAKRGGAAMLSEIRGEFGLTKSSSWRLARRLERKGLVKIVKIDSQIRLEIIKQPP
jgi:uncharacterized membrane protein